MDQEFSEQENLGADVQEASEELEGVDDLAVEPGEEAGADPVVAEGEDNEVMIALCLKCNAEMASPEDRGGAREDNEYCGDCTDPDGNLYVCWSCKKELKELSDHEGIPKEEGICSECKDRLSGMLGQGSVGGITS